MAKKKPKRISGQEFVDMIVNSNRPIQVNIEDMENARFGELVSRIFTLRLERAGFFKS